MEQYENIIIRPYKTGDATKIYSLFSQYTSYKRDDQFWVWINRIIGGTSIVVVAEYEDRIIGHYAIVPRKIFISGDYYDSGLGVHAFVAPEFREFVSIYSISRYAYQLAKEQGYLFIYGFPNENYRLIQEKLERWHKVALFNALELPVRDITVNESIGCLNIEEVNEISFSDLFTINEFYEQSIDSEIQLINDARYWLERFFLHPQKLYRIFRLEKENQIVGYIVTKHYSKSGLSYFHIVDYVLKDPSYTGELLQSVLVCFRKNIDIVSVWQGDKWFYNELMKLGFQDAGFDTFLGVKFLDEKKCELIQDIVLDLKNWRLVMGDSDAF